ncbi:MAG: glycosyltransferase family 2 protein [Candidatus Gastranaerophilales bacterium]|nr:glycosyltransferase family 2 protein [Candidatus Gastranaerophilales bacterium]
MKLVIQIPCYNEQESILGVLNSIPKNIEGIDEIDVFVINDGSQDETSKIARDFGVKVIDIPQKIGLSNVFKIGVKNALENNADILVNIDGDNQYCASDIEKLIKPILHNDVDITVGVRPVDKIREFSLFKKIMQKFGSFMVKIVSGVDIKDAASGFRALNQKAMMHLNIFNNFTYTVEMIIQAKYKNLVLKNVDISVNEQKNRKSKLFKSSFDYIFKQAKNLIRFFIIYRPCRFFTIISTTLFFVGFVLGLRFLYYYFNFDGSGHIQSLILCAIILTMSFVCFMLAIVGDLFQVNRKILEDIQFEIRQKKYKK